MRREKREREKREFDGETGKVWELVENNTDTNPPSYIKYATRNHSQDHGKYLYM